MFIDSVNPDVTPYQRRELEKRENSPAHPHRSLCLPQHMYPPYVATRNSRMSATVLLYWVQSQVHYHVQHVQVVPLSSETEWLHGWVHL